MDFKVNFKESFLEKYEKLLGDELKDFLSASMTYLKPSIRVNTLKVETSWLVDKLKAKGWILERIPWYEHGFWVLEPRFELGNTLEHQLGFFYLQEAASMLPPLVLQPKPGEFVLDLCAAPGSKTTQMAQMMKNTGIIVANDIKERIQPLVANLQRCGVLNTVVTRMDGRSFAKRVKQKFDKVLVDAPCSATGTIMKNPEVAKMWNEKVVRGLSKLQKALILSGFDSLKPGGFMVYSTCTLEPEEDEEVVNFLLEKREDAKLVSFELPGLKYRKGLKEWDGKNFDGSLTKAARIYPQDNGTEGFFIAKIKKVRT